MLTPTASKDHISDRFFEACLAANQTLGVEDSVGLKTHAYGGSTLKEGARDP